MKDLLRNELRVFCTAVMFFTRIPVPDGIDHGREWLQQAPRYFPLVGIIMGALVAGVWKIGSLIWPNEIAILLSMIAGILLTGAFHEDGFADLCDGFGGGWTKAQVLRIMTDSRVGAFGAMGIALMLGLKAACLMRIPESSMIAVLIAGHALSRWLAATILTTHVYVREESDAKAKPMATKLSGGSLAVATAFGLLPLFFMPFVFLWSLIPLGFTRWWVGRWFQRRIGGYTGDCLGAAQQIFEVVFYLSVLALYWNSH